MRAGVETSSEAIGLAEENARLNGVQDVVQFCRQDVADYMRQVRAEGRHWDLTILDPPKLAPNKKVPALLAAHSSAGMVVMTSAQQCTPYRQPPVVQVACA